MRRINALTAAIALALMPSVASTQTQPAVTPVDLIPPVMTPPVMTPPALITVDGTVTATDNGALAAAGEERHDVIVSVTPKLAYIRRGAGLDLKLDAAVTFLDYANGTQRGGVLPELGASLKSTVVERLLYIDAAARVRQSEVDPFGSRADSVTGANRRTEGSYSISPYIDREIWRDTSLLARHDASLTTNGAGDGTRLVSNHSLVRVERKPVPLGGAIEWTRLDNESKGVTQSRFKLDTVRVRGNIEFGQQLVLGAVAGRDHSRFLLSDQNDSLYGVNAKWSPGPRTDLSASVEHRFFGSGGELTFRHRMPFFAVSLEARRQPVMSQTSLGGLGQGSDLRTLLDGILTTRYPDPTARAGLVNTLVSNLGLDTRTINPVDVVAEYPQLLTSGSASVAFLGSRNTASLTLFGQTQRQLSRDGDPLAAAVAATADSRQVGGSFQFSRRLTPQMSADAAVRWSKISGIAVREGDVSEDKSLRLSLLQNLSPRTSMSAGFQQNRFTTTVSGQHPYRANLVFVGMGHRF
ncbi:MAG: TIGR03016 family PEP-CTERM system-associated outer membrane protein [Burkholderiales bacterium]|nr:TIGR03016 family PEP-CTERM system-associated outer membrane protein [Burkholderiales bacterium]